LLASPPGYALVVVAPVAAVADDENHPLLLLANDGMVIWMTLPMRMKCAAVKEPKKVVFLVLSSS